MDFSTKYLFPNFPQSIISSLYGIINSWNSNPNKSSSFIQTLEIPLGLKTLLYSSTKNPHRLTRHPSTSSSSSSLPSQCSLSSSHSSWSVDDLIGTENGVYMTYYDEKELKKPSHSPNPNPSFYKSSKNKMCNMTKEYPPTIPLLARTGNLPGRMPWVLTRKYVDGKLILKEERYKRHEYFEAKRENGRLILTLVSLDDTINYHHGNCEIEDLQFGECDDDQEIDVTSIEDDDDDEEEEEEEEVVGKSRSGNWRKRDGDLRMCYTYGGRTVSEFDMYLRQKNSVPLCFPVSSMATAMFAA